VFESGEYLKTLLDTMQDALMAVDEQGSVVAVNPAMEQLTGYRRDELVGSPCTLLEGSTCPKERAGGGRKHCALFNSGGVRRLKCEIRRKDGTKVTVLKNAAVLRDREGRVFGAVETLTDLSELAAREQEISDLRRELHREHAFEGMLGRAPAMERLFHLVDSAARSEASVLVTGETGTGKELVAQAIHRRGRRKGGPFIQVSCAAFNESLLESELFGHVRGAFTGAERTRVGRFEAAQGGDFLLDEIGDLPPGVQVKLLRVLQEKTIERVGENRPVSLDVRVLSATNRDLKELTRQGRFREDLYYRVAALPVRVPPLRERREDVALLTEAFLHRACAGLRRAVPEVEREALERLLRYEWPGNVRELMNAVEYALVMAGEGPVRACHLPSEVLEEPGLQARDRILTAPNGSPEEKKRLLRALEDARGKKAAAARLLGVSRVTLWKRLKVHGLG
jgi:two-component system, NtrC family, response regulator HydG